MKKLIALGLTASLLLSMSVVAAANTAYNADGEAAIEFGRDPGFPDDGVFLGQGGADFDFGAHDIGLMNENRVFDLVPGANPSVQVVAIGPALIGSWRVTAELDDFNTGLQGATLTLVGESQANALGGVRNVNVPLVAGGASNVFLSQNGASTNATIDLGDSTLGVAANTAVLGESQATLTFTFIPNFY